MTLTCQCETLRVCADPNNLPFSNQAGDGFENKIAVLVARDLGRELQYTWWSERKSFVRSSLNAGKCDVILGIASTVDSALTTQPYYESTYVFLARQDRNVEISSLLDDQLAKLRIGVHVVDNDYAPPAQVLAQRGLSGNITPYSLFGKFHESNPPAKLVDAVANGQVDIAIVWGPFAGYFARHAQVPLVVTPVLPPVWRGVPFRYDISMAVRQNDRTLKNSLDTVLAKECTTINSILADYGIPTVSGEEPKCDGLKQQSSASSR